MGGLVGEDVGDVTGGFGLLAVDVEGRIVVDALSAEGDPAVEAGAGRGVVAHMPFADIAGFVAAGVEKFGEGFEFVADGGAGGRVADDAVGLDGPEWGTRSLSIGDCQPASFSRVCLERCSLISLGFGTVSGASDWCRVR